MMVQQNLILILLLWCSGAEAPFKILLRWNTPSQWMRLDDMLEVGRGVVELESGGGGADDG